MRVGLSPSRAATWLEQGGGRETEGRLGREDHRPRVGKGRLSSSTAVEEENNSIAGFQQNWHLSHVVFSVQTRRVSQLENRLAHCWTKIGFALGVNFYLFWRTFVFAFAIFILPTKAESMCYQTQCSGGYSTSTFVAD